MLGFLYHQKGKKQDPHQSHKLISPATSLISESHLFRPDVDQYMVKVAISYGAVYQELTEVQEIEFLEDDVEIQTKEGEKYHGRFLVDASGYQSLIAQKLNLRESPTRLRTNSRAIFTHVTGLRPYDLCVPPEDLPGLSCTWHEGTLHHVFDGGWIWVIPFDNHHLAPSNLCSIGLMLDRDKFPKREDISPEQEFQAIIAGFPSIAAHLQGIKPVRKWISTDRIQYSSTNAVGPRYALLSHAYSFIDPIYSRGLISTFETIYSLASRLIPALKDDDFSLERFAPVERLLAERTDLNDRILYNTYRSMSHFALWNAMTQLWLIYLILNDTYLLHSCLKYLASGDLSSFVDLAREKPFPGAQAPLLKSYRLVLEGYETLLDRVDSGEIEPTTAADSMLALIEQSQILPASVYPWGDATARHIDMAAQPELFKSLIIDSASFPIPEGLLEVQSPEVAYAD